MGRFAWDLALNCLTWAKPLARGHTQNFQCSASGNAIGDSWVQSELWACGNFVFVACTFKQNPFNQIVRKPEDASGLQYTIPKLIANCRQCQLEALSPETTQVIVSKQERMVRVASQHGSQPVDEPVSSRTRQCQSNQRPSCRVEQRSRDGPLTRSRMRSPRKQGQPLGGAPSAAALTSNPLQACSSNSGTSVRPSDASALSSQGNAENTSDKGHHALAAPHQNKTMAALAQAAAASAMEPGQLTHAFCGTAAGPSGASKKLQPLLPRASQSASSEKSGTYLTRLRSAHLAPAGHHAQGCQEGPAHEQEERAVKDSERGAPSDPHTQIEQLKPAKKLNSETVPMRVTRSKAKQRQKRQDTSSLADVSEAETVAAFANPTPNGQQKMELCGGAMLAAFEPSDERPTPTLPKVSLEALAPESITAWREEECKQNASPRSQLSHMMIATPAGEAKVNTSFQVTEQSDALLENPLCALIKTYQNLRANASSTGKSKPTIHVFNERFEKEIVDLEEQYQLQRQLRKEQMRVFEQNYGSAGAKTPTATCKQARVFSRLAAEAGPVANDQPFTGRAGAHSSSLKALLAFPAAVEDCPMTGGGDSLLHGGAHHPHEASYNNSQLCAKENSQLGATSELTIANEVYQSFKFVPNALLNFYPKEIKRILNRRKTNNSQNLIAADLKQIRAPKQLAKLRKVQFKLKGLSQFQVNQMQVLMQKISRKSKVIKKQERIVSANLRRKEIFLHDENFNIVEYIERRAEAKRAQEFSQASEKRPASRARHSEISPKQVSRDPSSAGSRSNLVLRETCTNAPRMQQYLVAPDEVHSNDGNGSRPMRQSLHEGAGVQGTVSTAEMGPIHSGALSAKRKGSYQLESQQTVTQTPEPPSKVTPSSAAAGQENKQYLKAAEQIRQAVNGLGDIEDTLSGRLSRSNFDQGAPTRMGSSQLLGKNSSPRAEESCERQHTPVDTQQAFCGYEDLASVVLEQTPQRIFGKSGLAAAKHSETPMFDYENQKAFFGENEDPAAPKLTGQQRARAARTSQHDKKAKAVRRTLENTQRVDLTQAFNEEQVVGGDGTGYAIADLRKPYPIENKNVEEQHHPDGKISLTIKVAATDAPAKTAGAKNDQKRNSGSKQRKTLAKAHTVELPLKGVVPQGNSSGTNQLNSRSGDGLGSSKPDLSPLQQHERQRSEVVDSIAAQVDGHGRDYKAMGNFTSQLNLTVQQCYGLNFLGANNIEIQNEPFMFGAPAQEQGKGLIDDFIRETPATGHHQNAHQAVHQLYKSQSALVAPSHFFSNPYSGIMENQAINVIDQILDDSPDDEMPAELPQPPKSHARIMDPFFDVESPQELSSIEHSHTAFNQTHANQDDFQGANPYAAAKRKYIDQKLREQQRQQQRQGHHASGSAPQESEPAIAIPAERMSFPAMQADGDHPMPFEGVSSFEGHHRRQTSIDQPMQGAEATQSPENKAMQQHPPQIIVNGTTTPNRFTQIEGNALLSTSRDLDPNRAHLPDQNQLSVGRLCASMQQEQTFSQAFNIMGHGDLGAHDGAGHAGQEGQSALGSSVKVHQLSQMRGNIANTPAGLLSGQQVITEAHRQNFTVSDWNIEDNQSVTPAGLSQAIAPHLPAQMQPKQSPEAQLYPILRDPVNLI